MSAPRFPPAGDLVVGRLLKAFPLGRLKATTHAVLSSTGFNLLKIKREGALISDLEVQEDLGKVICLNSKLDFQQSQRVTLNFTNRERNDT